MTHWQTTRYKIDLSRPRIMGIVNVAPDSFSGDGQAGDLRAQLARCERLVGEGADILDIGGESTRPESRPVPPDEELARVLPLVREAVKLGVPVSVDTGKPQVMAAVLDLGADIINDVWALRAAAGPPQGCARPLGGQRTMRSRGAWGHHSGVPGAREIVARHPACGVCLMHMHGEPRTMQRKTMEGDAVPQVLSFLQQAAQALQALGVDKNRIVLDPGIGFGKTVAQNFALLARQRELLAAGYPLLVGWSRKSALGAALGDDDGLEQRVTASVAAALLAIERGARIVRVHDVAATAQAVKIRAAMTQQENTP